MRHHVRWEWIRGVIRMRPIVVRRGDTIVCTATLTSGRIHIFLVNSPFPRSIQFVARPGRPRVIRIPHTTPYGAYYYTAFFENYHQYGEGTTPIIIVRP